MPKPTISRWGTLVGVVALVYACSGSERDYGDGSSGKGGAANGGGSALGGKSAGGAATTGGKEPSGGVGGDASGGTPNAGAGGEPVDVNPGRPGSALVSGGQLMVSKSYRLVMTTGESPGGTQVLTSKGFRLVGGVIGTTQP